MHTFHKYCRLVEIGFLHSPGGIDVAMQLDSCSPNLNFSLFHSTAKRLSEENPCMGELVVSLMDETVVSSMSWT